MTEDVQQQVLQVTTRPLRRLIAHPEITDCELAEARRKFYDNGTKRRATATEGRGIDSIIATNDDRLCLRRVSANYAIAVLICERLTSSAVVTRIEQRACDCRNN